MNCEDSETLQQAPGEACAKLLRTENIGGWIH